MPRPSSPPIGLTLTRTAKTVSRAFDQALAEAGGSLPVWLILMSLKTRAHANQRELAATVGVQGATLTHHLNAMEAGGLITRARDPGNRRVHVVRLTDSGEAMFGRLAEAARAHDTQLRAGLSGQEIMQLEALLHRLEQNVAPSAADAPAAIPGVPTADRRHERTPPSSREATHDRPVPDTAMDAAACRQQARAAIPAGARVQTVGSRPPERPLAHRADRGNGARR